VAALVFVAAIALLALSTVRTSSARFAASTQSEGNVSSAVLALDLDEPGGVVAEIPLTETQVLSSGPIMTCADIAFDGSTNATALFLATITESTGLEAYADIQVLARRGSCSTAPSGSSGVSSAQLDVDDPGVWVAYEGPLSEVIGSIDGAPLPAGAGGGIVLLEDLEPGQQLAVGFNISLGSNVSEAQGRFVDLNFLVEVVA
jgi:hypothetical protein